MIKNILYSILIHLILFALIYYSFVEKHPKEIIDGAEISIMIGDIDNKNTPPLNENHITKPQIPIANSSEKIKDQTSKPITNETQKTTSQLPDKTPASNIDPAQEISNQAQTKDSEKTPSNQTPSTNPSSATSINDQTKINETNDSNADDKKPLKIISKNTKIINIQPSKLIPNPETPSLLSSRETVNIKSQIKLCYKRAVDETNLRSKSKVSINIHINQLGYIENNIDDQIDFTKYHNPDYKEYKIAIDNIKRALDLCSPLRNLPIEKYESWKALNLEFNSE